MDMRTESDNSPDQGREYVEPEWVDTPTSEQIWAALMYAQTTPTIALIHGGAGLGKTYTARRYLTEKSKAEKSGFFSNAPTVYMVTAHAGMRTIASTLCAISSALGRGGDAYRNDAMARQILQALNPSDLLIIDEAQHLDIKALDQIRYFHDEGGIGIAYLGNDDIHVRINGRGRQAAFLGPLASRVGMRLPIPHPTEEDVFAIMKAWKVEGKKEADYAVRIGLSNIGLRGLTQVLRQSAYIAKGMNRILDVLVMRAAVSNLGFNN
jgi:DNA transposition AAA+ family ATPase